MSQVWKSEAEKELRALERIRPIVGRMYLPGCWK